MITLEQLLDRLEVAVEPRVVDELGRQLDGGRTRAVIVHPLQSGSRHLALAGGAGVRLSKHTITILPPTARRVSEAGSGRIQARYQASVGLFDQLREPLVEKLTAADPIRRSFEELLDEISAQRPGCRAMVETLLRRGLILFLRRYCERGGGRRWLAALEDQGIGRAVVAMRDRPEHAFTLWRLAELAGMSRSVFAARFADSLGQSPMEFLKALRLARAVQLLTRSNLPVKMVAARVGYSSQSSFSRAFRTRHRIAPSAFRAAADGRGGRLGSGLRTRQSARS
jgi:AraC-like DNA-binding protein